ncbi:Annexin [Dictyocaulus viviparus]|uniref:Annexin n=1 Tax=Dictyocaulus viviparus TaxID=29172 RepID=A0A0D8XTX8_DICVI|nr:Annexin [Dictyocaulus viviparus]
MGEDCDATCTDAKRRTVQKQSTDSSVESLSSHNKRRLNMPMMYQMYESQYEDLRGTIYGPDSPNFHPAQASETLRKALNGLDTKDQIIMNTLLYHNNFQRQKILSAYEDMYGRKLIDDIEEETGGYFMKMAKALLTPAHEYDTLNLYRSISNRYADHSVAIEIACTRSARQLRVIRDTYLTNYKKTVDKDILVKVEGAIGRMLTLLLCAPRQEEVGKVDSDAVNTHAMLFIKNPIEKIAKNTELFEQIFIGNSWKHLAAVFDRVDEIRSGELDLETLIRKNKMIHSETRQIFLTMGNVDHKLIESQAFKKEYTLFCIRSFFRVARNMQLFFAEQLRAAMVGESPDHQTIIRVTVSRSEIDLYDIAEEYNRKYQRTLAYDIQQTCGGDYMRLAVALISASSNNNNHIV